MALARGWPGRTADEEQGQHDGADRDEDVAPGAVEGGEGDLGGRSGLPERVERHVRELPGKVRYRDEHHVAAQSPEPGAGSERLHITPFGNRLPQFTFEVAT